MHAIVEGVVVTIGNPHVSHPPGHGPLGAQGSEHLIAGSDADSPLSRNPADTLTLCQLLPHIRAALERLAVPGSPIMEALAENIAHLQDSFTDALYKEMSALGVDLSAKLTLRLDNQSCIVVGDDHPACRCIQDFFTRAPTYAAALAEIATQSATLRALRNLHAVASFQESSDSYACLSRLPGENTYQLSLKGEMNHFYFIR